jgi:hypothetical protein
MQVDKSKLSIKITNVLKEWANKIDPVKIWLSKLQKKEMNAMNLYYFCVWAETEPIKLLALKKDVNSTEAEALLDKFVADKEAGLTNAEQWQIAGAVKSFFKHNYKPLASASGLITLEKVKPYRKPSAENLMKLYRACLNPRDRSILSLICSSAIAKESAVNLKWKHLEENWEEQEIPHISLPSELIKGHGVGKWRGVRQETFITPEAKKDLIEYKNWIEQKMGRKFMPEDYVYVSLEQPFQSMSYERLGGVFMEMSHNAQVPFSPHDARRFVETALEEVGIHPNWARKIRGRKVKGEEAPYSQPAIEQLRAVYAKAVPLLQFTSVSLTELEKMISKHFERLGLKSIDEGKAVLQSLQKITGSAGEEGWQKLKEKIDAGKIKELETKTLTNGEGNLWDVRIVSTEQEMVDLVKRGYDMQELKNGKFMCKIKISINFGKKLQST